VGLINGTAVLKDAPHPYGAFLFYRWLIGEEGQKVFVDTGRSGAHPSVQPKDVKRPDLVYAMSPEDSANQARYQAVWKDIFQLR
jgi:ABC-type Fe3+ transport system substrate-binding protein